MCSPASQPDACTNPSYYWLGRYDTESMTFNLKGADGPFRLDLGDILYAPNTLEDTANVSPAIHRHGVKVLPSLWRHSAGCVDVGIRTC